MKVIKVEYRRVEPVDNVDFMYGYRTMKFHMVVEVEDKRYNFQQYVPDYVPYKELVKEAKHTFGRMVMDDLL